MNQETASFGFLACFIFGPEETDDMVFHNGLHEDRTPHNCRCETRVLEVRLGFWIGNRLF
jgi:hypothetical protein